MSTEEGETAGKEAAGKEAAESARVTEDSVGACLLAARTATGLSVAEVAQRLHCGRDLIEALESDRFADLGAPVFSRAHLRRYSDLLGLPVDDMLAQLNRQENRDPPLPDLTQVPRAQSPSIDLQSLRPVAAGVAGVGVFAVLVWAVLTQTPADTVANDPVKDIVTQASSANVVSPQESVAAVEPEAEDKTASAVDTVSSVKTVSPTEANTAAATAVAAAAGAASSVAQTSAWPARSEVIAQRGGFSLALAVDQSCWIEIYDKDGNALFYDMAQPGRRIEVSGAAPVRIRIGLAEAVSLEFSGRRMRVPADLIRESLAHFTISSDGSFRRYRPPPAASAGTESRPSGT